MADLTSSSLTIAAPPAEVLDVIADLPSYPEWNGEIKAVEVLGHAADGRPARARLTISSTGMSDSYVLAYDWGVDRVSWHLVEPSTLQKSQDGTYTLIADEAGTQVRYDLRLEAKVPMIGPMRRKIEKRIVDGALKELKKRVELLSRR